MMLDDIPFALRENIIFQYDYNPAHNAQSSRPFKLTVSKSMIRNSLSGHQNHLTVCNLTPLDLFFWNHLKTIVYVESSINLQNIKDKIITACNQVTVDQITYVTNNVC
jgi:hypothetical protein|uniref:Uncharacterized protein n=1 Tax=Sipha flava TaxID=143950 RepID=A0A2S2QJS7_9HEMI